MGGGSCVCVGVFFFFDGDERAARDAAGMREGGREGGRKGAFFSFINADGCHGSAKGKKKQQTKRKKKKNPTIRKNAETLLLSAGQPNGWPTPRSLPTHLPRSSTFLPLLLIFFSSSYLSHLHGMPYLHTYEPKRKGICAHGCEKKIGETRAVADEKK